MVYHIGTSFFYDNAFFKFIEPLQQNLKSLKSNKNHGKNFIRKGWWA